jgi:hypothetical protein
MDGVSWTKEVFGSVSLFYSDSEKPYLVVKGVCDAESWDPAVRRAKVLGFEPHGDDPDLELGDYALHLLIPVCV